MELDCYPKLIHSYIHVWVTGVYTVGARNLREIIEE